MQKGINTPSVSIIIPCFNAEKFIIETIGSIQKQIFQNFEIIFVDDGCTDTTEELVRSIQDNRIVYFKKDNSGVSDSRNKGFEISKGDFILFLDADDLLSEDFLEKRIHFLLEHPELGFCSSHVVKIDENGKVAHDKKWKGVSENILNDILSYNPEIITCPSSYLFRRKVITDHYLQFNNQLSSSADRFFLIEFSNYAKGGIIENDGILYYRVHNASMSNFFTPKLLKDNLLFQEKVLTIPFISSSLKKTFCFKTNYIFAGSYFKLRKFIPCFWYSVKAFYYNPGRFIKQFLKLN